MTDFGNTAARSPRQTTPEERIRPQMEDPWARLASLLPVIDLTNRVSSDAADTLVPSEDWATARHQVLKALFRTPPAPVVITGPKGCGKTSFLVALARECRELGSFLSTHRFIWIDCQNVGPEDSRACLESLFTTLLNDPEVVLSVDGLGALLRRSQGGTNKPLLLNMLRRPETRFIGVLSDRDYVELIGHDAELLDRFVRVEIDEPTDSSVVEIAEGCVQRLSGHYGVTNDEQLSERTVAFTSMFMLNEAQPAKSIRILEQVFSDRHYERTQVGSQQRHIGVGDVAQAIADKTGIPLRAVIGETESTDFETILGDAVVGQEDAVRQVAGELRLIKSGLSDAGKPATVLLFAGMTGVGKTELAKRIAELYSASKRLQVYTMGNFTEPHSVSGIIGVPPGYVGHEYGGRLINELNADPYSVFLLDEAEKCHPNVWKPFLNLFDEGWIVDQRGVKAYAERSIFILTTNAGDRNIAQMAKTGQTPEEIAERVKQVLSKVRHERSSQPVFPPQFLSRIKRIVVFSPLSKEAMQGIAELQWQRVVEMWRRKRERHLEASKEILHAIADRAAVLNEQSHGQEGGRIVRRLLADHVEARIQDAVLANPDRYRDCREIRLTPVDGSGAMPATGENWLPLNVEFV